MKLSSRNLQAYDARVNFWRIAGQARESRERHVQGSTVQERPVNVVKCSGLYYNADKSMARGVGEGKEYSKM